MNESNHQLDLMSVGEEAITFDGMEWQSPVYLLPEIDR